MSKRDSESSKEETDCRESDIVEETNSCETEDKDQRSDVNTVELTENANDTAYHNKDENVIAEETYHYSENLSDTTEERNDDEAVANGGVDNEEEETVVDTDQAEELHDNDGVDTQLEKHDTKINETQETSDIVQAAAEDIIDDNEDMKHDETDASADVNGDKIENNEDAEYDYEEEEEWEWEDGDDYEYEFYEVDQDEYKVQTFDGSFSIAI